MEYLVIAYDGTDAEAKNRRLRVRGAHLENVRMMKVDSSFIIGGAILDENEEMIGSTLYVEFSSREELDAWLETEPYVTGDVWEKIKVIPVRLALRD